MYIYFAFIILAFHPGAQGAHLRLFEHAHHKKLIFEGSASEECSNLPHGYDQASSIDTRGTCVFLYEHGDCKGRQIRVEPGSPDHHNLANLGFNDMVSSFRACTGNDKNGGGGDNSGNDYQKVGLQLHNQYRARHHAKALQMSSELNRRAEQCAKYYSDLGKIDHSCPHKNGAGDNLAWFGGSTGSDSEFARKSSDMWYNEVKDYNYESPDHSRGVVGHFTAMVWKSSNQFGMGVYRNHGKTQVFVVGLYFPHPNVQGHTRENVQRP